MTNSSRRLGVLASAAAVTLVAFGARAQGSLPVGSAAAPAPGSATPAAPAPAAPPAGSAAPAAAPPADGTSPPAAPSTMPPAPQYEGQPAPSPSPPPAAAPAIYVEQPPLPPPPPRTRHYHDGFYLRLSAGYGALGIESDYSDLGNGSASGSGIAIDLQLGGTPSPGLVIGGALLFQQAFRPSYEYDFDVSGAGVDTAPGDIGFLLFGPMIDVFPSPTGGFHFGGLLGLAQVPGLSNPQNNASSGFGLSLWTGYMWWAASQWSIGGLVRVAGAITARTSEIDGVQHDVGDAARSIALMLSTVYH